ncbi:MAG: prephenate dehydrogenase/arogenate dehydrogenase family protein [Candidatus Natronoplasma sp.]
MRREKVGIIGYGKMGHLLAKQFAEDHDINIYSEEKLNTRFNKYRTIESLYIDSKYIVIAVPSKEIESLLKKLSNIDVEETKTIFDISTFKSDFIDIYKMFPDNVKTASAHPMFGEGIESIEDEKVVIIPVNGREDDSDHVEEFFRQLGANTVKIDADEHDEMMKITIGIPYFLGMSYLNMVSKTDDIDMFGGTSFEYLTTYGKAVLNDSPEFIEEVIDHSRDKIEEFLEEAKSGEVDIERLKEKYEDEIDESYTDFYRVMRG